MKIKASRIILCVCICLLVLAGTALGYWTQRLDAELGLTLRQPLTLRVEGLEPPEKEEPLLEAEAELAPVPAGGAAAIGGETTGAANAETELVQDAATDPAGKAPPALPEEESGETPPADAGGEAVSEAPDTNTQNDAASESNDAGEADSGGASDDGAASGGSSDNASTPEA